MQIFDFAVEDYSDAFKRQGFVHITNGVTPEFLEFTQKQALNAITSSRDLAEWKIPQKKQQFLFEFPADLDIETDLMDWVHAVTGFGAHQRTICERHIKCYDDAADPNPMLHLDRSASEIAVGIPLKVPPDSHLLIYPEPRLLNIYSSTAQWRDSGQHAAELDRVNPDKAVRIYDKPGDVVMFLGSALLHERINAAGTTTLYFKVNSAGLDPLAEDPRTISKIKSMEGRSVDISSEDPGSTVVRLSPTFEKLSVQKFRPEWHEVHYAHSWGQEPVAISAQGAELISHLSEPVRLDLLMNSKPDLPVADLLDHLCELGIIVI